MKLYALIILCILLFSVDVFAVANPNFFIGEERVTHVPAAARPVPRTVTLTFTTERAFSSLVVDASEMSLNRNVQLQQRMVPVLDCNDASPKICNVPNLILETNEEDIVLQFTFDGGTVESGVVSLITDEQGPSISYIKLQDCEENCYVGSGEYVVNVGITDNVGLSASGVPLKVGARSGILPFECTEAVCSYNLGAVSCVDGSEVPFILNTAVRDELGNHISSSFVEDFTCDPKAPIITEEPRIVDRGPLDHLYEGVPIMFKAVVEDSSPVVMTVDFRDMDGLKKDIKCEATYGMEQICQGEIYSPPGPATGQAKITLKDSAGNIIEREVEVEIFKLDTDATPELSIENVRHKEQISRMLLATANQRENFQISHPVLFSLNPKLKVGNSRLSATIAHIEVTNCAGSIIQNTPYRLASTTDKENRIDFKLNPAFVQSSIAGQDLDGTINCTVKVWVKNSDVIYENPGIDYMYAKVDVTGADFISPGDQVMKKINEQSTGTLNFYEIVEEVSGFMQTLESLCSVSKYLDKGMQVAAAVEVVGVGVSAFDGGQLKKTAQSVYEKLFVISASVSQYGRDKENVDRAEDVIKNAEIRKKGQDALIEGKNVADNPKSLLSKGAGFMAQACTYITCSDAFADRGSLGDADSWGEIGNTALDQLSAPNAGDNFMFAYDQKCYPAMLNMMNEWGQTECSYAVCLKQMAMHGGDISSCDSIKSERQCKFLLGATTEIVGYELSQVGGEVGIAGDVLLSIKNFRERAATILINSGMSIANKFAIKKVVGSCEGTTTGDARMWACHIPYAVRLYIKSSENAMQVRELHGPATNLCELATCEGAECEQELSLKNRQTWDSFIEMQKRNKPGEAAIETARKPAVVGGGHPSIPIAVIPPANDFHQIEDTDYYVEKKTWNSYNKEKKQNYEYYAHNNKPNMDNVETVNTFDGNPFYSIPDPDFVDFNNNFHEGSLTSTHAKSKTNPEGLAPAGLINPSYRGTPYYINKDGQLYKPNNDGTYDKAWDLEDPGTYEKYGQVGAKAVNYAIEKFLVSGIRDDLNNFFADHDLYSFAEEQFCSAWSSIPPESSRAVFEPTANGFRMFDFNAEKYYDKEAKMYYYTLIFFMSGFDEEENGYNFQIYLKNPGNKRIGSFNILPGESYRPDSYQANYKSLRAFNLSKSYDQLCFSFSPNIPGKPGEFCKTLKEDAWSGLGDPYVPGSIIPGGRSSSQSNGGWEE